MQELSHLDNAIAYPDGSISFRIVTRNGEEALLKIGPSSIENVMSFLLSIAVLSAEMTGLEELSPMMAINHTAPLARDLAFSAPPGRPVILTLFLGNTQVSVSLDRDRLKQLGGQISDVARTLSAEESRHGAN